MKKIILFSVFYLFAVTKAQSISLYDLEKIYKLETVEKKCDYLYVKGFVKESTNESREVKLVKKKFIKRTQDFEVEVVKISNDSIIYLLNNSKSYVKLKNNVDHYYKEEPKSSNSLDINFKNRNKIIRVREIDNLQENNERTKFYSFTYYLEEKK